MPKRQNDFQLDEWVRSGFALTGGRRLSDRRVRPASIAGGAGGQNCARLPAITRAKFLSMKTLFPISGLSAIAGCLVILSLGAVNGAELVKARDGSGVYGYKDTPRLPWCEWLVHDPDRPAPPKVDPSPVAAPAPVPKDAVVLFDGRDLSQWKPSSWEVRDGLWIAKGGQSPATREEFGSFQLHLEWRAPADFDGPWHDRGNNGVLLHGLYEIQIFDSFNEPLYPDGQCAAVYAQTPPLVNVTRPPGEWQTFDIVFTAPKFDGEKLVAPAYVTMFHNGVLVHNHQQVYGATGHRVLPHYNRKVSKGPIILAGHGCPVAFRNIWIRPLAD